KLGVKRYNYLTDDPWNPSHAAKWFFKAVPLYDCIFSPRRANLQDLNCIGCTAVEYLPFGYDPALVFPEAPATAEERAGFNSDIVFIGSADRDRLPFIEA